MQHHTLSLCGYGLLSNVKQASWSKSCPSFRDKRKAQ